LIANDCLKNHYNKINKSFSFHAFLLLTPKW